MKCRENKGAAVDLIVAVSRAWGIGKDGRQLFFIPEDLHFFKETTWGQTVLLGRRTLAALPGGAPLPGRRSIVLSRDETLLVPGAQVCHNLPQLLGAAKAAPGQVWVMGGAQLYRLLLPHCRRALVTKIDADAPADAFFPNLDALPSWRLMEAGPVHHWEGLPFSFCNYENQEVVPW